MPGKTLISNGILYGGRKPTTVFETAPIDHSGTSPRLGVVYGGGV